MQNKKFIFTCLVAAFAAATVSAQTTATPAPQTTPAVTGVIGEVKAVDANTHQMIVRADDGVLATINLSDKTQYRRMAPGAKTLSSATDITLADVGQGDRVWARWRPGADQKTVPAAQLVVMSKADLAKKQEAERAEWRRRGVNGIVTAINPATQEITVTSRSLMGQPQAIIIPITDKVLLRRYPPDTIPKYSEAKPSKFEEVKVQDQLRALGDKSADGTHLTAEEVVFGTFKIAGGTITAIDPATNQIKINDLQKKTPLTITIKPESVIRRLPEGFGTFGGGGMNAGGAGRPAGQGQPPAQAAGQGPRPQGAAPAGGGPGGGRMGGAGNVADLLDRLPPISINDLKVGDTIVLSSLPGSDPTQLTAISVVSGIEPLLAMMAARQQAGGQARPQAVDLNSSFGGMFGGIGVP